MIYSQKNGSRKQKRLLSNLLWIAHYPTYYRHEVLQIMQHKAFLQPVKWQWYIYSRFCALVSCCVIRFLSLYICCGHATKWADNAVIRNICTNPNENIYL